MPERSLRPCPKCGKATRTTCCRIEHKQGDHHALYGRKWQNLRRVYLADNPCCHDCEQEGKVKLAEDVHHVIKHNGNLGLMYDIRNLMGLCRAHHNCRTAAGQ